ncbi:type II toxin-antitoxin system tRNA(fMet)-specific endonuclease VapC [Leptothoe spongobia]|uniref:Ribonuclease VapC n=1 Tax=Leptothoe spongobia TAU-MAC 1115 TaxID=1967444 RepID=A0A947DHL4_9CYAN|nr:type II toxin-antitoxin system VapC family toxin [Leptothoe spongobia]MBT9316484.1 type II toxin-antitoxin system VapC family toxin [Leptothoe spongobia TAU-MAC 1115]
MKYLLDTNICIYIIKRKPPEVFNRFRSCEVGDIGLSTITVAELTHGTQKSRQPDKNQAALDQFLLPLEIVDFDIAAAQAYGSIRAQLEQQGTPIDPLDFLIAAQALSLGISLVTNNEKEFLRVPGLMVENWV